MSDRGGSSTLQRDLDILEGLGSEESLALGGLGVVRLAEVIGRDKSQVSRALRSLEAEGLVERDAVSMVYFLSWRLYALAARTGAHRLMQVSPPILRALVARLGETVHLCVLRESEALTVISESPAHAFRAHEWEGHGVPIESTSAGRVLLLDLDRAELTQRFHRRNLRMGGPRRRVKTVDHLYTEIQLARSRGFATVDEEFEAGLVGASAPVRNFRGSVVAAVNVSAPKDRLGGRLDEAGREAARTASRISAALGCPADLVTGIGPRPS